MVEIMGRENARRTGLTIYHTGKACKKGHFAGRYVSTGNCVTCMKESSRKQMDERAKYKTIRVHVDDLETVKALNQLRSVSK